MKYIIKYNNFNNSISLNLEKNNYSNLNKTQWMQVHSKEFIEWFGDWKTDPENASKVIENGYPLICYHGTNEKFSIFDINNIGKNTGNYGHNGYGFYFSDDIREAKTYGKTIITAYLNIKNPFIPSDKKYDELKENGIYWIDDKIRKSIDYMSVYNELMKTDKIAAKLLKYISENGYEKGWEMLQNEEDITQAKIDLNDINDICEYILNDSGVPDYIEEVFKNIGINTENIKYNIGYEYDVAFHWITELGERSKEVTEVIKKLGYDGIISGSEYVIFDSKNIKSIDNNGDFSDNDNIFETYYDTNEVHENAVKKLDEYFHKKYRPEYVWIISENENILLYIQDDSKYTEITEVDSFSIYRKIEYKSEKYKTPKDYTEPQFIKSYSNISVDNLIMVAKQYQKLASYKYQKEFLTNTPEKYKQLQEDIEIVGYAPGIKEEFDWLFNAIDMKLM